MYKNLSFRYKWTLFSVVLTYTHIEVYIIYGDGSAGYSIVELDTLKRHGLNQVKVIVGNDGAWTQILIAQEELLGSPVANILDKENRLRQS